jgi:hypothetical protein
LDISHVLAGDGPGPVAGGKEIAGCPGLGVDRSAGAQGTGNHEAGSERPVTGEELLALTGHLFPVDAVGVGPGGHLFSIDGSGGRRWWPAEPPWPPQAGKP